jgi:hypothetical protein
VRVRGSREFAMPRVSLRGVLNRRLPGITYSVAFTLAILSCAIQLPSPVTICGSRLFKTI